MVRNGQCNVTTRCFPLIALIFSCFAAGTSKTSRTRAEISFAGGGGVVIVFGLRFVDCEEEMRGELRFHDGMRRPLSPKWVEVREVAPACAAASPRFLPSRCTVASAH
jgi:hypothetical protein